MAYECCQPHHDPIYGLFLYMAAYVNLGHDLGMKGTTQTRPDTLLLCSGGRSGNLEVSLTVLTFKLTTLLFPFALAANILT